MKCVGANGKVMKMTRLASVLIVRSWKSWCRNSNEEMFRSNMVTGWGRDYWSGEEDRGDCIFSEPEY